MQGDHRSESATQGFQGGQGHRTACRPTYHVDPVYEGEHAQHKQEGKKVPGNAVVQRAVLVIIEGAT